jgi:Protein of unknown function (DUF2523)
MSLMDVAFSAVKPFAVQALVSIGFGTVTYAGLTAAINAAISAAQGSLGGLTGDVSQILAMAGLFQALGIIAGGMTASVALASLKKLQLRSS